MGRFGFREIAMSRGLPVAISSVGCVSALGLGMEENSEALRSSRSGIRRVELFDTRGCRCQTAGEIDSGALRKAAAAVHAPAARWSRAAQMVLVAMAEALENRPEFCPEVVVVGTTSGGMDLGQQFYRAFSRGLRLDVAARRVVNYPPQMPVLQALEAMGCQAPVRVVSNACASGANALGMAWQLVSSGRCRRVLAGGYDALCELVFAGFDCLQASTPELCRPFDAQRTGLVLGEGAAMFCVESEGEFDVLGYGAATDIHHLTQPDPSGWGPAEAMKAALDVAGWPRVDYINAHGTATPQNDACEALAIAGVCPGVPVSSTKAATGHTLGAAGAIEAAFCLAAMRGNFLPATLNFERCDPACPLDVIAGCARMVDCRVALSNSFGFGGANAALVLQRR